MVQVKGIREGLLFLLEDGDWEENRRLLFKLVGERQEFWRGAKVALDSRTVVISEEEILALKDEFSQYHLTLWAVLSESPSTQLAAKKLGLATHLNRPEKKDLDALCTIVHDGEEAVLINKTLRSGYRVEYAGHVVVLGDVNPGAEIIAAGNIIVWGRLRGVVHAGAAGDTQAVVCALDFQPTQLRIADQIALPPQRKGKPQPEMARLHDGQLVAEPWNPKG
ncbi:MAG: septum site-determining protein MinC [Anaerolineales bacterium]|nr:septum site-determining protein MinC [Anaerolineales bacterium]